MLKLTILKTSTDLPKLTKNGQKWPKVVQNCQKLQKWPEMTKSRQRNRTSKKDQNHWIQSNQIKFNHNWLQLTKNRLKSTKNSQSSHNQNFSGLTTNLGILDLLVARFFAQCLLPGDWMSVAFAEGDSSVLSTLLQGA